MNSFSRLRTLIIDEEFKTLLAPLSEEEFTQLEENILAEGCLEPITVWNNTIIDGHNRYHICHKHNIPFRTRYVVFHNRDEAITWICSNQLGRRNISEETKKYLIGKKYETEKSIGARNARGINQHTATKEEIFQAKKYGAIPSHNRTAYEMGKEFNLSHNTVYKYGIYSKALDVIQKKCPEIAKKILNGKIKASHDNILNLSNLSKEELYSLLDYLTEDSEGQITYSDVRKELQWKPIQRHSKLDADIPQKDIPIKQLPKYDPDAEISSLALTIPSWISSIRRATKNTKFDETTKKARDNLSTQLISLKAIIDELMPFIKEDFNNG